MRLLQGFGKIYSFTLKNHLKSKGYRAACIIGFLACFLIPVVIQLFAAKPSGYEEDPFADRTDIQTVYVVDESESKLEDFSLFQDLAMEPYDGIRYFAADSYEEALEKAGEQDYALVLLITENPMEYEMKLVTPHETMIEMEDAEHLMDELTELSTFMLQEKSGLSVMDIQKIAGLNLETEVRYGNTLTGEGEDADSGTDSELLPDGEESDEEIDVIDDTLREVLNFVLIFLTVMVMYFLVLYHGQGVATSLILEKQNKLVDTFLISVKPEAILFGKILAKVTSAILQVIIWVAGVIAGLAGGAFLVDTLWPDEFNAVLYVWEMRGYLDGMFSPVGLVLGLILIACGFLLYCSLAGIGGSLASGVKDLGQTNQIFTLALVISFMAVLYAGEFSSIGIGSDLKIGPFLNWIPFTAVLQMPAKLILGTAGPLQGLGCIAVTLAVTALILWICAKIYKALFLHKGDRVKLSTAIKMIRRG